jgi:hypothetical protein
LSEVSTLFPTENAEKNSCKCEVQGKLTSHSPLKYFLHTDSLPQLSKNQAWQKQRKHQLHVPTPNNHPQPHLPWMMISANMLRSAFSFSSATSTGWNKPTTPSPWMMMMISDKALSESFSNKVKSKTERKKRCSRTRT